MPKARRVSASSYTNASRILIGSWPGSYVTVLLRLAESLMRDRLTSRPLELYGIIVNERFTDVAFIEPDKESKVPGAAFFYVATSAVSKLSIAVALTDHSLHIEDKLSVRIVGLASGPDRDAWKGQILFQEMVDILSPVDSRRDLLRCANAEDAQRALVKLGSSNSTKA